MNIKHTATEDKRTWVYGGKEANVDREVGKLQKRAPTGEGPSAGPVSEKDIMGSLAGLNLSSTNGDGQTSNLADNSTSSTSTNVTKLTIAPHLATGPSVDRWFEKLAYGNDGVLYEDVQIQIGIKSRYQGHLGQLAVYIGNKVDAPLTSFTTIINVDDPDALSVTFAKMPPTMIASRTQAQQILHVECKKVFTKAPILTVSFLAGALQTIALRLPIVTTKFLEQVNLGQTEFFERWKLIGGPPREAQSVFSIPLTSTGDIDRERQRQVVTGSRLNVLHGVDPNMNNIVSAGVLHMSVDGKVGCLMRLEPNRDAKVCHSSCIAAISY